MALECVMNVSEARRPPLVDALAAAAGTELLDRHSDPDHNRSVFTIAGVEAPRRVAARAVATLDIRSHEGVHPRFGVVDVVPFVPVGGDDLSEAVSARDAFASWAAADLGVPCFLYGPERSLPEVRRQAFVSLRPDAGPAEPHPSAGAMCVGARPFLVAYNVWLAADDVVTAGRIAAEIRSPEVRALALRAGATVQVSMNLLAPLRVGPADVYDFVAARAPVERAELVGLVPAAVLAAAPAERWAQLDLGPDRTIEARLAALGR